MECLDQLNSNLMPSDRASTASLSHRCPACHNQNALSPSSNTDNDPASRHHLTSPPGLAVTCSCPASSSSPTLPPSTDTVLQSSGTHNSSSQSTTTATVVTPVISTPGLVDPQTQTPTSLSTNNSQQLPEEAVTQPMAIPSSQKSHGSSPIEDFFPPYEHDVHRQAFPPVDTDEPIAPACLCSDQNPESNPTENSVLSSSFLPSYHQSQPIPIQSSTPRGHHRYRHHNDSDMAQGSLTPRAHDTAMSPSSWSVTSSHRPFSSSPKDFSPLTFYSQQSPKYFRQPSTSSLAALGGQTPETTPKVFDQWPRKSMERRGSSQQLKDSNTKDTSSRSTPSRSSKTPQKDSRVTSSRQGRGFQHSKWRSRWMSEIGDITMTPVSQGSRSVPVPTRDSGIIDPTDRPLPQELLHQLHDLEHENEDLSAEVVFALESRGMAIHEILGKGISSVVRRVTEKNTGQDFAVKIIDISGEKGDSEVVEQIKKDTSREIQILKLCGLHKNIIELYDVFETPTFIFLVFELCRQGELFDYLTSVVSLSEKRTRIFMRQLLGAVQYIHENNIVHRDLKPENILLDEELNIKVSDFGFATILENGQELNELCGTPGYLAPEVLATSMYENVPGYGREVDMWACGVIMYTLLCGSPPFWNRRQMMMLRAIMNADYTFNSPEWDDISDPPKNLIQKLLVVNPKERLTAREALAHPFFESKVIEAKKFEARRKFKGGVYCVIFFHRLFNLYKHPPPMSMDTLSTNPYSIKLIRKSIDTCAFSMYRHWVKRVDNQNRAALFEHTIRDEWKQNSITVANSATSLQIH